MNRDDQMCIPLKDAIWLSIYTMLQNEKLKEVGVYISLNAYVQFH